MVFGKVFGLAESVAAGEGWEKSKRSVLAAGLAADAGLVPELKSPKSPNELSDRCACWIGGLGSALAFGAGLKKPPPPRCEGPVTWGGAGAER